MIQWTPTIHVGSGPGHSANRENPRQIDVHWNALGTFVFVFFCLFGFFFFFVNPKYYSKNPDKPPLCIFHEKLFPPRIPSKIVKKKKNLRKNASDRSRGLVVYHQNQNFFNFFYLRGHSECGHGPSRTANCPPLIFNIQIYRFSWIYERDLLSFHFCLPSFCESTSAPFSSASFHPPS